MVRIILSTLFLFLFAKQAFFAQTSPNFKIGTKWIYETMEYPFPIKISYQTFEITDTNQLNGISVFVIENDHDSGKEYMHVDGSKIYFWDSIIDTFQLTFDFGLDSTYATYWEGACATDSGTAVINIDSTTSFLLGADTFQVQHLSIQNSGTIEEIWQKDVIINIGPKAGGLRIYFGYGFCDFLINFGELRCFETDSENYNFVGYACDSTWFSLATTSLKDTSQIIYPNPTKGIIKITDLDVDAPYELYNIQGKQIQSGMTRKGEIKIDQQGIFFLKLLINTKWITRKVLVTTE